LLETEQILRVWLKIVPDYTVIFTRLVIINVLIDCISGPLMTAAQASGKIKLYQSVVGGLLILNLPISYLFLKFGFQPQVTIFVSIGISILALMLRLLILRNLVKLKIENFFYQVILKITIVGIFAVIIPLLFSIFMDISIHRFIIVILTSIISSLSVIFLLGLSNDEKNYFVNGLKKLKAHIIQ
ncbi:MAG TPA: lipopolysaccharide biosynthesis protein, partial [Gallicola sp.]|nr:lipopolysaccharide biosynthesis protein [Gallicola sp.]